MDPLIIVSSDSHAGVPKELWAEYLESRFHDLIPRLHEDNEIYPTAIGLLTTKKGSTTMLPELQEAHQSGWHGLHDPVLRLADMDREGVAAELIFHGDFRLGDLFHNTSNRRYPLDVWDAGARAWNRWAADTFGFATDRFLVTGAIGPCDDLARTVADLDFLVDHGFAGTYLPGYMSHPGTPALADPYWEPFWAACAQRGLAVVVHAGFGWEQGVAFQQLEKICADVATAAGSTEREVLFAHAGAVSQESIDFFFEFANSVRSRRPLWQLTLGGVFDRHPDLKLMLTEIRADWIPATLQHLDALYDDHRADLPARRPPSEYWHTNCLAGASFIHKAEVEMRHQIGVETVSFGRDFPHPESTWPHTREWLRDAFAGVPEHELRLMLGENVIRFLDLDRHRLWELARRIGPSVDDVLGHDGEVDQQLIDSFANRGGYLKPAEGGSRLDEVDRLLRDDLPHLAGLPVSYGRRTTTDDLLAHRDLSGLHALVTGASAGLGVETVRALANRGATVIAVARDAEKARRALSAAGVRLDSAVTIEEIDLASLASVRAGTDRIAANHARLGLLVANAGVMACPESRTTDGFETQFGTNHLGHFVLVNRLVPLLIAGAPSRVITVSSAGHRMADVDLEDPNFDGGGYVPFVAYGRSKTANVLFAVSLDHRLRHRGVRAASVHPGGIDTELGRHLDDTTRAFIEERRRGNPGLEKTVAEGAATSVWAGIVADPDEIGGRYAEDCAISPVIDGDPDPAGPVGVRSYALDLDHAEALWARSEELVGEQFPIA